MSDQLLCKMMKLVVKVVDLDDRDEFSDRVLTAWTAKDENEMYKVIIAMNVHLEPPPATDTDTSSAYPDDGEYTAAAAWYRMLDPGTPDAVDEEPVALEGEDADWGRKKQTDFA